MSKLKSHQARRVQFGIPSAVEYEIDRPPGHLTPISQEVTRKRYSMDPKEPTLKEDEVTQETKQNNLILSEWEGQLSAMTENKSHSSYRSRRNGSSSNKRNRRNRRSSSIFSPSSLTSLVYDHSNQNKPEMTEYDTVLTLPSSHSKAAILTRDLTSVCASSTKKSFAESSSYTTSQAIPVPAVRPDDESQTWHFVADLGSINSKGAMELSPDSSTPKTDESVCGISTNNITTVGYATKLEVERSPPLVDVNFDTFHSFGAIDKDLPNHQHTSLKEHPTSDSSLSYCEGPVS